MRLTWESEYFEIVSIYLCNYGKPCLPPFCLKKVSLSPRQADSHQLFDRQHPQIVAVEGYIRRDIAFLGGGNVQPVHGRPTLRVKLEKRTLTALGQLLSQPFGTPPAC